MATAATADVITRDYCRACASADPKDLPGLVPLLSLGPLPLSGFPATATEAAPHPPVPLTLVACPRCALVQLRHTTPFEWMFGGAQYWYRSGVNESMRAELKDVVCDTRRRVGGFTNADTVLDIGANDGTLLSMHYAEAQNPLPYRLACEPSTSVHGDLRAHCNELYTTPFPTAQMEAWYGKVKVITACAMIYDLEDPHAFFTEVASLLTADGVCLVQFQDLLQMLQSTAFDCICHEHLEYYSLYALAGLLNHCGLWVTDVEARPINGGSLRVTIQRRGARGIDSPGVTRVLDWLAREDAAGLTTLSGLQAAGVTFSHRMRDMRRQIRATVAEVLDAGGTIDLLGASTKGNTLLPWVGLDARYIRRAWERSPEKVGRFVGQSGIPIVSDDEGRLDPPTLLLAVIWQFREGLLAREAAYLLGGGTLLFPLPGAELVRVAPASVAVA